MADGRKPPMKAEIAVPTVHGTPDRSGVGAYRPRAVVDNAEVCRHIDSSTSDPFQNRHRQPAGGLGPDETLGVMRTAASRPSRPRGLTPDRIPRHPWPPSPTLKQTPAVPPKSPTASVRRRPRASTSPRELRRIRARSWCPPPTPYAAAADTYCARRADDADPCRPHRPFDGVHLSCDGAGPSSIGPSDTPGHRPVVWEPDGCRPTPSSRPTLGTS